MLFFSSQGLVLCVIKHYNSFNCSITTIVVTIVIVSGNRFLSEWEKKMDGRCGRGIQSILITAPPFHIPINFGLITFQLNQGILTAVYSTQ